MKKVTSEVGQLPYLDKYEKEILRELQTTLYQGLPLIDLVIKNVNDRNLSFEQTSKVLGDLDREGKVNLSENTISYKQFDRIIIAHYEQRHKTDG